MYAPLSLPCHAYSRSASYCLTHFFFILLLFFPLFHCILSVWRFCKKKILHINPLYQGVRFPFCVQMRLLVPPCIYICMCVHALLSSTIFSACFCVYAPISSVISVRLPVCTCICLISSVRSAMSHQLCQSSYACLPLYVDASQIHRLCIRSSVPILELENHRLLFHEMLYWWTFLHFSSTCNLVSNETARADT